MSYNTWMGDAAAVKQVHKFTVVAGWAADDTATLACGRKSITFTAVSSGIDAVAAGVVAAWNASTEPELAEVTASSTSGGAVVSLTAKTAGGSFAATASVVTASTGDITGPTTGTANSGPNCWNVASNWSLSAVPTSTDNVRIEDSDVDILHGLTLGTRPASLDIRQSFTGYLGLPRVNANGYVDYRETYLTFGGTTGDPATPVDIGKGEGTGSGRIKIAMDTASPSARTITIHNRGSVRADADVPTVLIKGSTGDNLVVNKGDVGVALYAGETANLATVKMAYVSNKATDAKVRLGIGVSTGATITKDGGELEVNTNQAEITQTAGKLTVAAGKATTINVRGGTCIYTSTGTTTTVNVASGGILDYGKDSRAKGAPTDVNLYSGASLYDPGRTVAWDANLNLVECGLQDVTVNVGKNMTLSST